MDSRAHALEKKVLIYFLPHRNLLSEMLMLADKGVFLRSLCCNVCKFTCSNAMSKVRNGTGDCTSIVRERRFDRSHETVNRCKGKMR